MKILHLLYSGLGGHGNVFFSMVNADVKKEFEYLAFFNGVEEMRDEYIERCRKQDIPWFFVKKKRGLDTGFYKKIYTEIKKAAPQMIFLHGSSAILPAVMVKYFTGGKKKIIVRETQANHLKENVGWMWLIWAMLFADKMVFLSTDYLSEVKKRLKWMYRPKKCTVIPNGIDLNFYKPGERQLSKEIILGMQSRLVNIKDHLTLIEAFCEIVKIKPELRLKIAGDGENRPVIEKKIRELKLENKVELTGMLSESGLLALLQGLDLYIHASFGETMSTAIMQAMACRKPVIASDVPGINNMLIHMETGILVPVNDRAALSAAILNILNDKALGIKIAENAFQFAVANYSNIAMFDQYKKTVFN